MDNAKKFFEEIIKTEEAKTIFASFEKPENEEETVKVYAEVAAKLGIELSVGEIMAYIAKNNDSGEVDDEELSQLSGGGDNSACSNNYRNAENCWWNDGCDIVMRKYDEYQCKRNNVGAPDIMDKTEF